MGETKKLFEARITSVKFKKKYFQSRLLRDYERNQKIKIKKIFLDSSPHRQPAQKGEGVYESKCMRNILGG